MRPWPRNLLGQTLLAVALALLAAQAVSAVLLVRAAENRREAIALHNSAMALLIEAPQAAPERALSPREQRRALRMHGRPSVQRVLQAPDFGISSNDDRRRAEAIRELLSEHGGEPVTIRTTVRAAGSDPYLRDHPMHLPRWRQTAWRDRLVLVTAMQMRAGEPWFVSRVPVPRPEPGFMIGILIQTAILFLVLMGVLFVLLKRITRPLAQLSDRVERFTRTQSAAEPLAPSGPNDVAQLIVAHNAMEARIAAMLDEKDVMLGAIGHDLKTPLAALRVRIESISDEASRTKMAATIEEIAHTLDDILSLARIGRADGSPEPTNLAALVAAVVEEFEDLGEPVTLAECERIVLPVHLTWLKRALRNLVANAVRYGGGAQVSLLRDRGEAVLRVEDDGPGIPENRIAEMLEPFRRGEASRNRATGGAGLGLTLARAIAEQHGGALVLANRSEGGLRAEIRLPID